MENTTYQLLLQYTYNGIASENIAHQLYLSEVVAKRILNEFMEEWESVEVGAEGATLEKDNQLDNLLEKYTKILLKYTNI